MTQEEAIQKLNISVDLIPAGSSNRPGTRITPTHITIHNTANAGAGANAAMHARYVKGPDARARKVSWHFTVDDRRVFKHLPTNEKGWHAGGGNARSIGIEVCEHRGIDKEAAIDRAALLTALMMLAYGIPRERVVPHRSWTGKDCPRVLLREPGGFDAFRDRADRYLEEMSSTSAGRQLKGRSMAPYYDEEGLSDEYVDERFDPELRDVVDLDEGSPAEVAPGPGEDGGDERIAQLERLVGRLVMENYNLRQALEGGTAAVPLLEPEAA